MTFKKHKKPYESCTKSSKICKEFAYIENKRRNSIQDCFRNTCGSLRENEVGRPLIRFDWGSASFI